MFSSDGRKKLLGEIAYALQTSSFKEGSTIA
nr:MAG TPA: hypothetical protein [Microviridae sp.]